MITNYHSNTTYLFENFGPFFHLFFIVTLGLTVGDHDDVEWESRFVVLVVDEGLVDEFENVSNSGGAATKKGFKVEPS